MDQIAYVDTVPGDTVVKLMKSRIYRKELMEQSGFRLIEVEEDEIKRKRWSLSLEDSSTVKTASRAWVELGIRLTAINNRT